MNVELKGVCPNTVLNGLQADPKVTADFTNVKAEEFRTIYFALKQYSDFLEQGLKDNAEEPESACEFEHKMFSYNTLSKIHGVLFEMLENFNEEDRAVITKWADCI